MSKDFQQDQHFYECVAVVVIYFCTLSINDLSDLSNLGGSIKTFTMLHSEIKKGTKINFATALCPCKPSVCRSWYIFSYELHIDLEVQRTSVTLSHYERQEPTVYSI